MRKIRQAQLRVSHLAILLVVVKRYDGSEVVKSVTFFLLLFSTAGSHTFWIKTVSIEPTVRNTNQQLDYSSNYESL